MFKLWLACDIYVLNAGKVPAGFGVLLKNHFVIISDFFYTCNTIQDSNFLVTEPTHST